MNDMILAMTMWEYFMDELGSLFGLLLIFGIPILIILRFANKLNKIQSTLDEVKEMISRNELNPDRGEPENKKDADRTK